MIHLDIKIPEAAIVDFEEQVRTAYLAQTALVFAGHELDASMFFAHDRGQAWQQARYFGPSIWTIDEWFENRVGGQ